MRELIRLKANLFVGCLDVDSTSLFHATKFKNEDGTRNYKIIDYLLGDDLMKDWCENALVENHGLDEDELKLYNNPDPITMLLDCQADAHMDYAERSLLLKAGFDRDLHLMKLLINKGANIKALDRNGLDLLDQILSPCGDRNDKNSEKQFEILKYLHSLQTIPIPMDKIVPNCPFHIVAYFLNFGFDPCFITPLNQNILHIASQNLHPNFLSNSITQHCNFQPHFMSLFLFFNFTCHLLID
jgi:hypothetical protein